MARSPSTLEFIELMPNLVASSNLVGTGLHRLRRRLLADLGRPFNNLASVQFKHSDKATGQ